MRTNHLTGNEQGELPLHVCSTPGIKATLQEWDASATDPLMKKWRVSVAVADMYVAES